jgi:hypothetical protein
MTTLQLISLTCVRTQESHDQAYVRTLAEQRDDAGRLHDHVHETDPRRMHDGTSVLLGLAIDFDTHVDVQVWEQDRGGDDHLGSFTVNRAWVNLGEWREDVRHRGAHYVVTFEVTDTHARPLDHAIELRSLRCVNAQEASDEVFLKINGETVTTTMDMDDDEPARALDVHRSFHRNVFVELWEDDAGGHGSDCLGRMTLLLAEVQRQLAEGSEPVRFSWRSGAVNAVYELDYRLTR